MEYGLLAKGINLEDGPAARVASGIAAMRGRAVKVARGIPDQFRFGVRPVGPTEAMDDGEVDRLRMGLLVRA